MSDETEDGAFESIDDSAWPGTDEEEPGGVDGLRDDLLAAIAELGLALGSPGQAGPPVAGCYLSTVPVERDGGEAVVVRWQLRDTPEPGESVPARQIESVDILNEALGPLLLALGFPIQPYAVDGGWIVTGPRS
ncbi:MAG: hypothetical protein ABSG36_11180 [Acidimicrobiales bacterium]|jgi:hypothetical protein